MVHDTDSTAADVVAVTGRRGLTLPQDALIVLGAAEEQIPLYREARRRGVQTIAVDMRPDRPALPIADAFLQISTRDTDALAAALGDIRPAGIVSCASDAALATWHALGLRYDTPYVYPETALAGNDKARFHEIAGSVGVANYGFTQSQEPGELVANAAGLRFPLVVKPADGSGSKGVRRVPHPDGLPAAIAHARIFAASGAVIVEEFVEGRPLAVEIFMRDGTAHFTDVQEKEFVLDTDFVLARLHSPARLPAATRARLEATAERLCLALGITSGPANFDIVLGPDGRERVIEANPRLGGDGVPRLLAAAYGVDIVRALVALALGEPYDLTPTRTQHATVELIGSPLPADGELVAVEGLSLARAVPGVTDLDLFVEPGDRVRPHDQSGHKIGVVVAAGATPEAAAAAAQTARALLRPVIRPLPPPPLRRSTKGIPDVTSSAEVARNSRPFLHGPESAAVADVLASGHYGHTDVCDRFEQRVAAFLGVPDVVAVSSGTAALHLALQSAEVTDGEVLVPSMTYCATIQAILAAGAHPRFLDVGPATLCITAEHVLNALTPATRAVVPVLYGGRAVDLSSIAEELDRRGVIVVEDAAHAFGSFCGDVPVGANPRAMTCFSFGPIKNLTCGQGGAIVPRDPAEAGRLRRLRGLGILESSAERAASTSYTVGGFGYRAQLSTINAAIGLVQLDHFPDTIPRRRALWSAYAQGLAELEDVVVVDVGVQRAVPHLCAVQVPNRDRVFAALRAAGIDAGVHYPPNHLQPAFSAWTAPLPVTERVGREILTLPFHLGLNEDDVTQVVATVQDVLQSCSRLGLPG